MRGLVLRVQDVDVYALKLQGSPVAPVRKEQAIGASHIFAETVTVDDP